MSNTTVAEFAAELKKSTSTLIEQLKSAGVAKSAATDTLSDADKQKLLAHLQASHGTASGERKKITLVKKSTTEIKQADATGKARTIQVEVRKKRTLIQRDESSEAAETAAALSASEQAKLLFEQSELERRQKEAEQEAAAIRDEEAKLIEQRRLREEQELHAVEQNKANKQAADIPAETQAPETAVKKPTKRAGNKIVPEADPKAEKAAEEALKAAEAKALAADAAKLKAQELANEEIAAAA